MRHAPEPDSKWDREEVEDLNAEPWMLDLLRANPEYTGWGPYEDYMSKDGNGWDSRVIVASWADFTWGLDDLNEVVNFYFEVERASKECATCEGNGYHPEAQRVVNTFYAHMNSGGESWKDKITEDELAALVEAGRVPATATVDQINAENRPGARGFGHDAINRSILTEARIERLGLKKHCPTCEGRGSVYTEDAAHVGLVLWFLHPRKGCSRGVHVQRIQQSDIPAIRAYLAGAAARNAARFAKIATPEPS